ncbi:hypothetical protein P692DRAFT_20883038 [Suillus brevipes Sb2]|nr:hypothetical protein P692DRAFT_20883038 [Suillus brevipes Sb2]
MPLLRTSGQCIRLALDSAWAASTRHHYHSIIQAFLNFCDIENIPPSDRCPASEHLLCAFAASRIGVLAGSTIQSHMSALKVWHSYHNVPWKGAVHLRLVLSGVANRAPSSSLQPPRPPVTRAMVLILASKLNLADPFDCCCLTTATSAFWGQLRLGEVLSPWQSSFPTSHIACREHLSSAISQGGSRKLHLPFTKVKKNCGEDIVLCHQQDNSDPIHALEHHLRLNDFPLNMPLFCYSTPSGLHCLTKRSFLARCNSIWQIAGFAPVTGHSFHIGGTTEMLLSGVPPDVIKALGRWSSDAFLRYWHSLEHLAPRHVENLAHCMLVTPPLG